MRNFNNSRRPSYGPRRDSAERGAASSHSHERRGFSKRSSFNNESEDRKPSFGRSFSGSRKEGRPGRGFGSDEERSERRFTGHSGKPGNSGNFRKKFSDGQDRRPARYGYGKKEEGERSEFTPGSSRKFNPKFNQKFNQKFSQKFNKDFRKEPVPAAATTQTDGIRLNKYISNSGVCSRREADEYIKAGLVSVNGQIVTEMGVKVTEQDDVRFNGERLKGESKVYILMNKPKDVVTTVSDPHAETTVIDLIRNKCDKRVFPVGRLDKATTGVLLLTNDGDLAEKLTHPSFEKKKIYHVFLDRNFHGDDMKKLVEGITLEDGPIHVDTISYVDGCKDQVGVEIHSGRNRIVRRMFEHLGYKVKKLDRVYFAGLTKRKLRRGEWRYLTDKEVSMLMMGAFE